MSIITFFAGCKEGDIIKTPDKDFSTSEGKSFCDLSAMNFSELQEFITANVDGLTFQSETKGTATLSVNGAKENFKYVTCYELSGDTGKTTTYIDYLVANNYRKFDGISDDLENIHELYYGLHLIVIENGRPYQTTSVAYYFKDYGQELRSQDEIKFENNNGLFHIEGRLIDLKKQKTIRKGYKMTGHIYCD